MISRTIEPAALKEGARDGQQHGPGHIFEIIPEPVVVVNHLGRVCLANAAARGLLVCGGTLPEQPFGFPLPSDDTEVCFREADGKPRVRQIRATATEWQGERAWVVTLPDITGHHHAQESLRQSQTRQRALLESSLDCVVVMDAAGRILDFNTAAERTFGYSQREVLGRPMAELLLSPAVREAFEAGLERCLESSLDRLFDRRIEVTAKRKGGAEFAIEMAVSVTRYGEDPVVTAVLHDITPRKQAHHKLVRQTQHLEQAVAALERVRERERQVLASIPSIFIGLDDQGKVTHWNPAAEKQFGLPTEQAIGKPLQELAMGWAEDRIEEAIARCNRLNEAVRIEELHVQDSKGRERILTLTINRTETRGEDGGVVLVGTNITARKAMEAQLMLAQKMESIGQLAAGIAHEINTPTQYVSDNTRFLKDSFQDFRRVLEHYERLRSEARLGPVTPALLDQLDGLLQEADLAFLTTEIPKAIEQSLEGLSRVAEIVRAMKQFSHPDQDEPELTDLNKAIENTVTVARNEWKYVAEMEMDLDPQLPAVPCLAGRFNQVILNLVVNAAQAIAELLGEGAQTKGVIRVATRNGKDHVEIRVSDTGAGIPAAIRNRVFDPFFAIAHNIIVEQHGGAIAFESEEGKGTTFILTLPLSTTETPAEDKA
jgi:PAS domain S-box-containing protein